MSVHSNPLLSMNDSRALARVFLQVMKTIPEYLRSSRSLYLDSDLKQSVTDREKKMPSKIVRISWRDDGAEVDNDLPWGGGSPSHDLPPHPVYPSHGLPGLPPQAIQLPVLPFDPSVPDQGLPERPVVWPPRPGNHFIVKWLACHGLVLVPDNSLPGSTEPEPK